MSTATMLSPLLLLALAGAPESPTSLSLSFGFEPRFGTYAALDQRLTSYGYAPVGSAFLPTWGLRGRAFFTPDFFGQLSMSYGLRVAPGSPAPTTSTLTETMAGVGYHFGLGFFASLDAGFSAFTQSVSSSVDGGALVYMGPSLHPRVGWLIQLTRPWGQFLAVTAGFNANFPVAAAHSNPLWEDPFTRTTISAFTIGIEAGLGYAGSP